MQTAQKFIVPVAIVIAGGLIAAAVYFSNGQPATKAAVGGTDLAALAKGTTGAGVLPEITVAPISNVDHLQGSKEAKVTIIEYSDTECPFCKRYHDTLKRIFAEYGAGNKVAWVYRHFPLDMHKKAPKEAEALECANELGGNEVFWKYTDIIYTNTPSNDGLDHNKLYEFAATAGLDKNAFKTCLDSGKYADKIAAAKTAGYDAGARGTPYTVFLVKTGNKVETIPLVGNDGRGLGAVPYEGLKSIVEKFLNS
jgi:protein-disulfide isomerase